MMPLQPNGSLANRPHSWGKVGKCSCKSKCYPESMSARWLVYWVMHRPAQRWIFTPMHLTKINAKHKRNSERRLDYEKNKTDPCKQKYLTESACSFITIRKRRLGIAHRSWKDCCYCVSDVPGQCLAPYLASSRTFDNRAQTSTARM